MKKLILSVAVLFATTVLFAQQPQNPNCIDCDIIQVIPATVGSGSWANVNDIDQFGDVNIAHVYQEGAGNYSKIDQNGLNFWWGGNDNTANVSQQGGKNHSDIDQNGDRNTGNVNQIGWSNYTKQVVGVGYAEDNTASSTQHGGDNIAYQSQYFDNNTATIYQSGEFGAYSYGFNNYAKQFQSSGANGVAGSDATITQLGDDNEAEQTQNGSNNNAYTYQMGDYNTSVENQTSIAGGLVMNDSDVYQYGWSNKVCINQDADGANNMSYVMQIGLGNTALVDQTADASALGDNMSNVNQTGWFNSACVTQYNQSSFTYSW
jgi:hypothetical protein